MLREFHLHGASLIAFSRVLPVLVSFVVAWWAVRRLGLGVLEPVLPISLITMALSLRLVFEVNLGLLPLSGQPAAHCAQPCRRANSAVPGGVARPHCLGLLSLHLG